MNDIVRMSVTYKSDILFDLSALQFAYHLRETGYEIGSSRYLSFSFEVFHVNR